MYLTIEEYVEMGGKLQESDFARFEYKARKTVDAATQGRITEEVPVRESVKRLMYELVVLYSNSTTADGPVVSSTSADGFSETYVVRTEQELQLAISELVSLYLSNETTGDGVPLLFLGVR